MTKRRVALTRGNNTDSTDARPSTDGFTGRLTILIIQTQHHSGAAENTIRDHRRTVGKISGNLGTFDATSTVEPRSESEADPLSYFPYTSVDKECWLSDIDGTSDLTSLAPELALAYPRLFITSDVTHT